MKTLQECKDQIVREDGWNDYRHFCSVQPAEQIIVLGDRAAELYARVKWDQACEAQKKLCSEELHTLTGTHSEAAKPEFKP